MAADRPDDITYTVDLADLLSAQRLAGPSPWTRAGLDAALFGASCAVAMELGGSPRPVALVAAASAALAIAYAGLAHLLRRWWLVHRVGRIYRRNASFRGLHRGRWDDAGMESENDQSRQRVRWTDIVKRREDSETVLLYQSPEVVHFIPKRVLSPAQLASLRPHLDRIPTDRGRLLRSIDRVPPRRRRAIPRP